MDSEQIKKWRKAYPEIDISDDALASMDDCASLYASDYANYLETKGNEALPFVRSLARECSWTYGNWQKSQRDGNAKKLLADLLNNARGGPDAGPIMKFLRDYMKANNIPDDSEQARPKGFDPRTLPGVMQAPAPEKTD